MSDTLSPGHVPPAVAPTEEDQVPGKNNNSGSSQQRNPAWGAWVVIAGLAAIVAVFGIAATQFDKAADVATAVGAVSGVIAAIVGAYFGIRGATLAQAQSSSDGGDGGRGAKTTTPAPAP